MTAIALATSDVVEQDRITSWTTLYNFATEAYEREDDLNTGRLLLMAQDRFLNDSEFLEDFIPEAFRTMFVQAASSARSAQRKFHSDSETTRERLARIFEHVGERNHVSLLAMTKPQHLFVAEEREQRAETETRWANLHRAIAGFHKDNTKTTGEILTETQLDRLWRKHIEND